MSEPEKSKNPDKKHIIDVEEPGKSAPASTSRPVLVSNRPILKDPMVVEKDDADSDEEKPAEKKDLRRTGTSTIQPLKESPDADSDSSKKDEVEKQAADAAQADEPKPPEKPAQDDTPAEHEAAPTAPEKPADEAPSPDEPKPAVHDEAPPPDEPKPAVHDEAPQNSDKSKPTTDAEKKIQAESAEQAKHAAAVQKLVDEGQYILPINTGQKRKAKNFVVLGVVLAAVLVLAWLDIALDAHLISLGGVHSVTHFFSN